MIRRKIDRPSLSWKFFNFDWGEKQSCEEKFSTRFKNTTSVLRIGIVDVAMYPSRTSCGETFVSLPHHHARRDAQALWLLIISIGAERLRRSPKCAESRDSYVAGEHLNAPFHVTNCTSFWTNIFFIPRAYHSRQSLGA
jgi:hypothetical protein